jgi:hypothetical protein
VLGIFIALTNPSYSVGFEAAYIGLNCKHAYHYTAEDDSTYIKLYLLCVCVWEGGGVGRNTCSGPEWMVQVELVRKIYVFFPRINETVMLKISIMLAWFP